MPVFERGYLKEQWHKAKGSRHKEKTIKSQGP
jgi:hypothetical protein